MSLFSIPRHAAAGALAAAALLAAGSAFAQKAALVQNQDDGVRAPYQEGVFGGPCTFQGNCAIIFSAVPAGHRRMIEHLSCYISLVSGSIVAPVTLGSQAFRNAREFVPAAFVATNLYVANSAVLMYYEAGEVPRADAYSLGGAYSNFICTISGRDVTVP